MSQENVEKARDFIAAYNRRDFDAAVGSFDPEIEWDATAVRDLIPDLAEVYWGHEGVRTYWRRWLEAWRYIEFDIQDVLDAGDEIVVLICNQRQWGRYTGIASELPPFALIYTFRDGKVVRFRVFPDQDTALKAVGLSE